MRRLTFSVASGTMGLTFVFNVERCSDERSSEQLAVSNIRCRSVLTLINTNQLKRSGS